MYVCALPSVMIQTNVYSHDNIVRISIATVLFNLMNQTPFSRGRGSDLLLSVFVGEGFEHEHYVMLLGYELTRHLSFRFTGPSDITC